MKSGGWKWGVELERDEGPKDVTAIPHRPEAIIPLFCVLL